MEPAGCGESDDAFDEGVVKSLEDDLTYSKKRVERQEDSVVTSAYLTR